MVEQLAQLDRDATAVEHVGRRAGIEIEHDRARAIHVGQLPLVGVQLERGEVREPHERGEIFDDAAPLAAVGLERIRRRTQPGWCGGQRFSKNRSPWAPLGARTSVGGRPARWGSITGAIRR